MCVGGVDFIDYQCPYIEQSTSTKFGFFSFSPSPKKSTFLLELRAAIRRKDVIDVIQLYYTWYMYDSKIEWDILEILLKDSLGRYFWEILLRDTLIWETLHNKLCKHFRKEPDDVPSEVPECESEREREREREWYTQALSQRQGEEGEEEEEGIEDDGYGGGDGGEDHDFEPTSPAMAEVKVEGWSDSQDDEKVEKNDEKWWRGKEKWWKGEKG